VCVDKRARTPHIRLRPVIAPSSEGSGPVHAVFVVPKVVLKGLICNFLRAIAATVGGMTTARCGAAVGIRDRASRARPAAGTR
jgi:hypothetical protein